MVRIQTVKAINHALCFFMHMGQRLSYIIKAEVFNPRDSMVAHMKIFQKAFARTMEFASAFEIIISSLTDSDDTLDPGFSHEEVGRLLTRFYNDVFDDDPEFFMALQGALTGLSRSSEPLEEK